MATIHPASNPSPAPSDNQFLAALPAEEFAALEGELELVDLPLEHTLSERYVEMEHVYFPVDCALSLLCFTKEGGSAEIAVVGFEGIVGVSLFMGGDTTPIQAVVQSSGQAYRLPAHIAKNECFHGGAMQGLLLRYTQVLLNQVALTAACNTNHTLDQQLCRWLLLSHDRLPTGQLIMPSAQLGNMRGVWHEVVREALSKLHRQGLIQYDDRDHITITDRAGLEARSCGCYDVVKHEYDRLLPVTND